MMSYLSFDLFCAFWHIARICFARCWFARLFRFILMSVTLMLHLINQTINKWNQSIKQTNQINQINTRKSIKEMKQSHHSINACACALWCVCVCMCLWHGPTECGNQTNQSNQSNQIIHIIEAMCACACACTHHAFVHACMYICMCVKHAGDIQSTNTCMCISGVHCVCEMHAHAFALQLYCLFVYSSLWK